MTQHQQLERTLTHAATQWDIRQSRKRGYNIYALAQYLSAVDEICKEVRAGATIEAAIDANANDRFADVLRKAAKGV